MNRNELNIIITAYETKGIATHLDCTSLGSKVFAKEAEKEMHNMGYDDASCACGQNGRDCVYGIYDQKKVQCATSRRILGKFARLNNHKCFINAF